MTLLEKYIEKNSQMPLIAILRGITPAESVAVSDALFEAGITIMEVTLNSPDAYESIRLIHQKHGDNIILGAGTVLTVDQVIKVKEAGGTLIISPNMNPDVIMETKKQGILSIPGCYTPTESFKALEMGADMIKIFPADTLGVKYINAIKAVLPKGTMICPTGGVDEHTIPNFVKADVTSMGLGSALYKAGKSPKDVCASAKIFVQAYKNS